jgi:hypothetical protein
MQAARELSQLAHRFAELLRGLTQHAVRGRLLRYEHLLDQTQRQRHGHESLLRAVMQIALQAAARLIRRLHDAQS